VGYQKLESAVEQGAFELVGRQHPQTSAKRLGERHLEPRSLALLMLEPANKFTR